MNALIIGGSQGVGYAIAEQLAKSCDAICIASRNSNNLEKARLKLLSINKRIIALQGDVADVNFVQSVRFHLEKNNFPSIDILVCNAGGPPQNHVLEASSEDWDRAIQVNLLGQIRLVREFIPEMAERKFGRIIFISSTIAREPSSSMVLSATTRAGISAFAKSISTQFASSNVTVNSILLGGVLTHRLESLIQTSAQSQETSFMDMKAKFLSNIPVGRFAEPSEISRVVTFLVSADSGYITGQSIAIDGGLLKGYF